MSYPAVEFSEMRDKLKTIDETREALASTEPLSSHLISKDDKIRFTLDPAWATTLESKHGADPVDAAIIINGTEHRLTKDAAIQAGTAFGLPEAYIKKTPASLIEAQLNYWFSGGLGDRTFNALSNGNEETISAFAKPTIAPFSNLQLLENALAAIREHRGTTEVLVDYKFTHSLVQTDIRLILPEYTREITNTSQPNDVWSAGIHLSNSLIGKKQTSFEGYLFRWWCTNGCTTELTEAGRWSRKKSQDEEDVLEWARESVDGILGGLEDSFDKVQALTAINLGENTADVIRDIFDEYKIPVSQRQAIIDTMINAETLTMYELQQAITRLANDPSIRDSRADTLMRIGGNLISDSFDPIKARVFREGQIAGPEAPNRYAVRVD